MAARVLLLSILCTVGLLVRRSKGLELGLQFSVEPQDCVVSRNKPALLQCSSNTPKVSYQWTLDNKPLPLVNNTRLELLSNGSLYFKKLYHKKSGHGLSDQGTYQCIIRSPIGALVSRPAQLRFASMSHEIRESGLNISVMAGDPVWLPCSVDSLPPAQISWQHDSKDLPQSDKFSILYNGTLIINQAQKDDQGNYSCTAWNAVLKKKRTSDVAVVTVEDKGAPWPLEILRPASTTVNWTLGERVSLACIARGSPTPAVKWTKLLHDQSSTMVTPETDGVSVLTVDAVTVDDSGLYTCVASQVISGEKTNTISITKEVRVEHVLRPPGILKSPQSQESPTAKIVRFPCEADGFPQPDVVWYRDGYKLPINGRIKLRKNELLLSNTVSNDTGLYQCLASNSVGSVWAAARLVVNIPRNQPRPPSHLACSTVSSSSVNLTWKDNSQGLQAFTIHYLPSDGGEERMAVKEMSQNEENTQTYTVDKLSPYTNYTLYVRSYNNFGASDNSEEVICQTGESAPRGAPVMSARPQSPMTIEVEWRALAAGMARGAVSEHKVQWRRRGSPSTHVDTVPGDVTHYTITGLQPDSEYEVRVLAATQVGWPSLTEHEMPWTVVTTPSLTAPLLPPPIVQLTAFNSTTVQVRWSMASSSREVEGFLLSYRDNNGQSSSPLKLPASSSEYLLANLEAQTWYEVQVRGVAGGSEGEVGVRAIHTLPPLHNAMLEVSLAPPTSLEATPGSPTTINLTWVPPAGVANVSFFTVSYQEVSTSVHVDDNNTNKLYSSSNSMQVPGLKPFTLYELKVRTHDYLNRHSEYSQTLECRTLQGVPGRVTDVQWKPLNTSSVRVMWKAPNVTNGYISGYTIFYTKHLRQPLERWNNVTLHSTKPSADLTGLTPNVRYSLVVRAATIAGLGNASEALEVFIPARESPRSITIPSTPPPSESSDQLLGILLGCAIGGTCVILCMATLLYRRKCSKPGHSQCHSSSANGAPCFHAINAHHPEHHEMQCLPNHLDSKGGHPIGEMNGLRLPLLNSGRLPNGVVTRDRSVRITENPQFECGVTVSCEELRQPSEEGDSLLSGHSLNDTQLTTATVTQPHTPAQVDKHEPDDGFHESNQPVLVIGPNG